MNEKIKALFYPQSIAVVGVSNDLHKLGSIYYFNLLEGGYKGKVFPINPKYTDYHGVPCYPLVSSVPEQIDQVAIVIPSQFVLDTVKDCAKKGVKAILIISAGFGEIGEEGKKLEQEILCIAKENNMNILGPNIIGVLNTANKMNSSWMQLSPVEGDIAFLSQSGAFCTGVLDMALKKNLGFYNFCSIGNKIDIDELDLVEYWLNDPNVKVIGAYLEEINSGYQLMKLINTHTNKKPVILLKTGKSKEARQAITSHTGSIAGSTNMVNASFEQSSLVETESITELISNFMTFSWSKTPKGNKVAIISNAGGPGIMATDALIANNLQLAVLSEETKTKLSAVLPPASSIHNPIDLLGDALAERYLQATEIVIADPGVNCILYILTPQYITQIEDTAKIIIGTKKFSDKPIFAVFLGDKYISIALDRMYDEHIPAFNEIDIAFKAMGDLIKFAEKSTETDNSKYNLVEQNLKNGQFTNELNAFLLSQTQINPLPDDIVTRIVTEVGLDIPAQIVTSSIDEALSFSNDKYPVVIKATNKDISHKTDFKALYINLNNENDLRSSFMTLLETIRNKTGNSSPQILVQEQIKFSEEIFIGANREGNADCYDNKESNGFGHLIVTGKGGIYTEVYNDFAFVLVPATKIELEQTFLKTNVSKIIQGVRGQDPLSLEKIVETLEKIERLLLLYPQITSLDINPLLVTKDRAVSVDIKIFID